MHTAENHHVPAISDEQTLDNAGVRLTAVRLLVWRTVRHGFTASAFTMADVESALPTVDRSTLFRTLGTLVDAHLLHAIDDGTGMQKYCVCHHNDTRHCGGHIHFTCLRCHRTYCFTAIHIPPVHLPDGFQAHETEYVVKGICPRCAADTPSLSTAEIP